MNRRIKKKIQKKDGYKVYKNFRYARIYQFVDEVMCRYEFDNERDMVYIRTTANYKHLTRFYILKDVNIKSTDVHHIVETDGVYSISFKAYQCEDNPLADRLLSIYKDGSITTEE